MNDPTKFGKPGQGRYARLVSASAEIFLEVDADEKIIFADGRGATALGLDRAHGRDLLTWVVDEDRALVRELLTLARSGEAIGANLVRLNPGRGRPRRYILTGVYDDSEPPACILALSRVGLELAGGLVRHGSRDPNSGLLDRAALADLVRTALESDEDADAPLTLTLLDLRRVGGEKRGAERMGADVGPTLVPETLRGLGAVLRARALAGAAAAQLSETSFALLHRSDLARTALSMRIADIVGARDASGAPRVLDLVSVSLASRGLDPSASSSALDFVIDRFLLGERRSLDGADLRNCHQAMLGAAADRITGFRHVVSNGAFEVAYQAIVDLKSRQPHHYEALARFGSQGNGVDSPFQMITFAEDIGMICEFDLAMCERVVQAIEARMRKSTPLPVAVNISGRSLDSRYFVDALGGLLERYPVARRYVMFEVTESSEIRDLPRTNRVIQQLRAAGHHVCLDDFGAGAAAFQYLRALDVDLVKIDGGYVRDAVRNSQSRAFLKAMTTLCADLGIDTVAEMVEDEMTAGLLKASGVRFGQGFLFGQPSIHLLDIGPMVEAEASPLESLRNAPVSLSLKAQTPNEN